MMFGLFKGKEKNHSVENRRVIKNANIDGFIPPSFVKKEEINHTDIDLVEKLCQEFVDSGAVDKETHIQSTSAEELAEMVERAGNVALNEKDFHDREFDEQLYKDLDDYEKSFSGGQNTILDEELDEDEKMLYNSNNDFFAEDEEEPYSADPYSVK